MLGRCAQRGHLGDVPAGAMVAQKAGVETGIGGSEPAVATESQPFDAFAEMAGIPVKPCFRPPAG